MALADATNIHNIRNRLRIYASEKGYSELERLLQAPVDQGNAETIARAIVAVPNIGEALRAAFVDFPYADEIITAVVSNPNDYERVNVVAIVGYTIFNAVTDKTSDWLVEAVRATARMGVTYQGIVDKVMPIVQNDLMKKEVYSPFNILRGAEVLELPEVVTLLRGMQETDETFRKVLNAVVYEVGIGLRTPATTEKAAKYLQQFHGTELEYAAECIRRTYRQRKSALAVDYVVEALEDESFRRMKQRYAEHPEAFKAMMDIVNDRINMYSYLGWNDKKPIIKAGYVTEVQHIAAIFEDETIYRVMTEVREEQRTDVYKIVKQTIMQSAEEVIHADDTLRRQDEVLHICETLLST